MRFRTNRREHDQRGYGGNIAWGERTVRKDGRVHFDNQTFQHDALIPFAGQRVYVSDPEDIWYSAKIRVDHPTRGHICYAVNEHEREQPGGRTPRRKRF